MESENKCIECKNYYNKLFYNEKYCNLCYENMILDNIKISMNKKKKFICPYCYQSGWDIIKRNCIVCKKTELYTCIKCNADYFKLYSNGKYCNNCYEQNKRETENFNSFNDFWSLKFDCRSEINLLPPIHCFKCENGEL